MKFHFVNRRRLVSSSNGNKAEYRKVVKRIALVLDRENDTGTVCCLLSWRARDLSSLQRPVGDDDNGDDVEVGSPTMMSETCDGSGTDDEGQRSDQ